MKVALCQLNPVTGDIAGNTDQIIRTARELAGSVDLCVFPELFVQGYPARDLLEQPWFVRQSDHALQRLCAASRDLPGMGIVTGCIRHAGQSSGKRLFNSAVVILDGRIVFWQDKRLLPTYDVFDEYRYFEPAQTSGVFAFKGEVLGITICEDAWNAPGLHPQPLYAQDPVAAVVAAGATLLINISASPFHLGKQRQRLDLMAGHARRHDRPFLFVNQTGGNDELIFDGTSLAADRQGAVRVILPSFAAAVRVVDTAALDTLPALPPFDSIAMVHDALVMGIADYCRKCGFSRALIGLSGGIDSAVTAALAARALGPENVSGVAMPSRYSSQGSQDDARQLALHLGIRFLTIPIEPAFSAFLESLTPHFAGRESDITEENLQARIRGTTLMALSNKFGCLVLTTGNKSELAVGYCTLYGDMNGGLSVISDLPKSMVYALAGHINAGGEVIPRSTIEKPPSAELRPDQRDSDSLPDYDTLDAILAGLIEEGRSVDELAAGGYDRPTVEWVAAAIRKNEYKRRQAAPGLKVTPKAFGTGRRFPVAARYSMEG